MTARTAGSVALDIGERTAATAVQVFLAVLVSAGMAVSGRIFLAAADQAAFGALVALVTSVLVALTGMRLANPYVDLAYRTVLTFGQALLAALTTSQVAPSVLHLDWPQVLRIACVAAAGALVKGLVGLTSPQTRGASVLVAADDRRAAAVER